jgi:hypothetical protein
MDQKEKRPREPEGKRKKASYLRQATIIFSCSICKAKATLHKEDVLEEDTRKAIVQKGNDVVGCPVCHCSTAEHGI